MGKRRFLDLREKKTWSEEENGGFGLLENNWTLGGIEIEYVCWLKRLAAIKGEF